MKLMKLIIDMPDQVVEEILQAPQKPSRAFLRGAFLYLREALRVATPILDNATNKDVMCAFFGQVTLDKVMCIDPEWWNAPYKADKE